MSIYALKPQFQNLLRPWARRLHRRGVSANQVTLAACILSLLLGGLLSLYVDTAWLFALLPLWLLLRMALNAIDGMLAREFGQQSPLGGYLNETTDVIADTALYLPFAWVAPFGSLQIGLVIWLATLSELCGILGQVHGNGRRYDGPVGKSDRALVFGVLGLWYALAGSLPDWLSWPMWALALLLALTCGQRVRNGLAGM